MPEQKRIINRHPFKRAQGPFIGPGPRGFIHYRAKRAPWSCRRLGPYHYECSRLNPRTGRVEVKELTQSPTKKAQYNKEYKKFRKHLRKGLITLPPVTSRTPVVRFKSHSFSGNDQAWFTAHGPRRGFANPASMPLAADVNKVPKDVLLEDHVKGLLRRRRNAL